MKSTHGPDLIRDRPTIGVLAGWQVHAGTPDSFLHQVFRGIHAAAQAQGCNLLLGYSIGSPRGVGLGRPAWPLLIDEADFVPVGPWNADGLIIAPPILPSREATAYFKALQAQGYPIVCAGSGLQSPAIVPDNASGIRQAMAHLVAHGHSRIAFVAGHEGRVDGDSGNRLKAYVSFLEDHGLPQYPDLIAYSAHTITGGRQAMQQILDRGIPFSAVVTSNDLAAVGARAALREAGLSVPGDVALIGFDDRVEARAMVPQLTTVHYPIFEVGYRSVALLLRYLQGDVHGRVTEVVPTRLVVRESCGCLSGGMSATAPASSNDDAGVPDREAIVEALTELVVNETHALGQGEIRALCARLVRDCCESLSQGETHAFRHGLQQILEEVVIYADGLQGWQAAISGLRAHMADLKAGVQAAGAPVALCPSEIEEMLHQARIAINAMVEGQQAREKIYQADSAYHLYQMTARFQTAQDEGDILAALEETLPQLGIHHVAVALYEAEGSDAVAWSVVHAAPGCDAPPHRFPSREFPPPGFYPADRPFHWALTPLLHQGTDLIGFVAFDMGNLDLCADITWLLAAALHGLQAYRAAVEGQRLAEEANRMKGRFLSMVSHELRTPLNLISGLSDLLLQETEDEASRVNDGLWDDLERIYVNAKHLDDLLRDVLDLARSEAGQLHLTCESLDLREILDPVAVIAEVLVQDTPLVWRTEIPESVPWVWGDHTRLRQVLLNLVNNAAKFTAQGEIVLRVVAYDETVTVAVQDTGIGIPPEEQALIFDEFRQSERTAVRGYGGLGLGLAICKRLIEMHGGEIGVRSSGSEGAGSEFYFILPTIACPEPVERQVGPSETTQQIVLLAQDQETGRALEAQWRRQGLEVIAHYVAQGDDWLRAVLAASPDAVILDQDVAATQGWEILKVLKQKPETRRLPVLFRGGQGVADQSALMEVDFLTKPVITAELGEALIAQGFSGDGEDPSAEVTILVVDDDPGSLDMHTRIVQQQSPAYRVLQARDGYEALAVIRRTRPDLVLLDLMMPRLDGFGVLEAMRERPASRGIPVIILTGQTLTEQDMARLNHGMVSVLSKGLLTEQETIQHLEAVLSRQRRSASEAQEFVMKAMAYIHTHYMTSISRSDIADHVGVSERHLSRCFRQETCLTPILYLNRYRIRQAKRLLEVGQMGITDVAMAVGFSSGGYFSRVFRQETGVSPLAYQQGVPETASEAASEAAAEGELSQK